MTNYNAIQLALERSIAAAQEDLAFLKQVNADPNIIKGLEADIVFINEASEIVWQYQDLSK